MVKTIGNPFSWTSHIFSDGSAEVAASVRSLTGVEQAAATPEIQTLTRKDLSYALRRGVEDFTAFRSDVFFIVVIYPIAGLCLAWFFFHQGMLQLLFPLASGFLLVGPIAAINLYEMSRRRELGDTVSWSDSFALLHRPSMGPVLVLGGYLLALFMVWIFLAYWIYVFTMGPEPPTTLSGLVSDVLNSRGGGALIMLSFPLGFIFASIVLVVSVVAFPMLIDRDVGLVVAVKTSVNVARKNPIIIALWGLIVVALMFIGALPALAGLIFVMPVLGHATWHLYRRAVKFG